MFCACIEMESSIVGRLCLLTKSQSMQEISALLLTSTQISYWRRKDILCLDGLFFSNGNRGFSYSVFFL